ncbi:hypothetical protein LZ31DRAFT_163899 [Colletotrichum somersetense]|nr:hypothetical protein LZ31DRAFT_163899 [Colletotrichum somersetense]
MGTCASCRWESRKGEGEGGEGCEARGRWGGSHSPPTNDGRSLTSSLPSHVSKVNNRITSPLLYAKALRLPLRVSRSVVFVFLDPQKSCLPARRRLRRRRRSSSPIDRRVRTPYTAQRARPKNQKCVASTHNAAATTIAVPIFDVEKGATRRRLAFLASECLIPKSAPPWA